MGGSIQHCDLSFLSNCVCVFVCLFVCGVQVAKLFAKHMKLEEQKTVGEGSAADSAAANHLALSPSRPLFHSSF